MAWWVLVVWKDGRTEHVCRGAGGGPRAEFRTKREAEESAEFLRIGIVPDEAQSVNVVRASRSRKAA